MTRFQMRLVGLLAAALTLIPLPAAAKEPVGATIDGGGLAGPIDPFTGGDGPGGRELMSLMSAARFFELAFQTSGAADPPTSETGEAYTITWDMGGTEGIVITEKVYLWAEGGPLAYIEPGQAFYDIKTPGGWMRASTELAPTLAALGVPTEPPTATTIAVSPPTTAIPVAAPAPIASPTPWVLTTVVIALLVMGAAGLRRRPREAG
ncbi:MAG TPA: hypothetical protein VID03_00850 [Acidimicrobiia bacterium]|jgi:hypothetical protein